MFKKQERIIPIRGMHGIEILAHGPSLLCGTGDKKIFKQYTAKNGPNYIDLDVEGPSKLRERKVKKLAGQFGATKAWQTTYSIPDTNASYNLWDEKNEMLSFLNYDGKIITFTQKALEDEMGKYKERKSKEISLIEELRKKYKEGFGGYEFTKWGLHQLKNIEKLLKESVKMANHIGADVINVNKIKSSYLSNTLTISFFKK